MKNKKMIRRFGKRVSVAILSAALVFTAVRAEDLTAKADGEVETVEFDDLVAAASEDEASESNDDSSDSEDSDDNSDDNANEDSDDNSA
jgi:TATA-binding protein-associated factor Taf7